MFWNSVNSKPPPFQEREGWGTRPKGNRNPVGYASLEDLGIDPSTLKWEKIPIRAVSAMRAANSNSQVNGSLNGASPLTIPEAKKALAMTFGVEPEAIEITIRG